LGQVGHGLCAQIRWLTYDRAADLDSPEQMGKFLDHIATHRLGGCFALTLLGLRRKEVGQLRWSDVELETGTLHIRRDGVDANGRDTIMPTRTERSAPRSYATAARARE
jgi:integrase